MSKKALVKFRISGTPEKAIKEVKVRLDETIYKAKDRVRKELGINKHLAIQFIYGGQVMPEIAKLGDFIEESDGDLVINVDSNGKTKVDTKTPITIMSTHSGG